MRVLVTAFEPFDGAPSNVTELVVAELANRVSGQPHIELSTAVLPVTDAGAAHALHAAIDACRPEAVIALGEAAARTAIDIERLAVNLRDYRVPDNDGTLVREQPVADGPAAYFARLPLESMRTRIEDAGVHCRISRDAGLFLCNQVMYELLHRIAQDEQRDGASPIRWAGFLHVPLAYEQVHEIERGARVVRTRGPGVSDPRVVAVDGSVADVSRDEERQPTLERLAVALEQGLAALLAADVNEPDASDHGRDSGAPGQAPV